MAITGSVFAIKKHRFKIKADMKDGKQNASTQHIPRGTDRCQGATSVRLNDQLQQNKLKYKVPTDHFLYGECSGFDTHCKSMPINAAHSV